MKSHVAWAVAVALLVIIARPSEGQFQVVVGPSVVPFASPVWIAIMNEGPTTLGYASGCTIAQIRSASGQVVHQPIYCAPVVITIPPGTVYVDAWSQFGNYGAAQGPTQVPPGTYTMDVLNPTGTGVTSRTFTIGGSAAALMPLGVLRPGYTLPVAMNAPSDAGWPYLIAAAAGATGIPTCGGTIPLALDPLLLTTIAPGNGLLTQGSGTLGSTFYPQLANLPTVTIPNVPQLTGATFALAFVALDPAGPCLIRRISAAALVTVQ